MKCNEAMIHYQEGKCIECYMERPNEKEVFDWTRILFFHQLLYFSTSKPDMDYRIVSGINLDTQIENHYGSMTEEEFRSLKYIGKLTKMVIEYRKCLKRIDNEN